METCRSHTRRLVAAATELPPNANAPCGDEPSSLASSSSGAPRAARRLAAVDLGDVEANGLEHQVDLATAVPRWLDAIADRMATSLSPTLATAERAWDQADHVRLLDGALRAELGQLLTAARLASDTGLGLLCRLALDATLPGGTVVDRFTAWAEPGMRVALRDGSHGIVAADVALVWGGTCAVGTVTAVTSAG